MFRRMTVCQNCRLATRLPSTRCRDKTSHTKLNLNMNFKVNLIFDFIFNF
ncbi:Uncharacterized protein APZ42_009733 [Daphnia magna]|uniref:Uncharacterized protein n=1 Tax=Daphnia magna TaxID=35525 RepID=A0A164DTX1_9CRUS|nr:Uncharacterized protein APZ42_009733 [Daphnia magna]